MGVFTFIAFIGCFSLSISAIYKKHTKQNPRGPVAHSHRHRHRHTSCRVRLPERVSPGA
jgi:hypothetical protein